MHSHTDNATTTTKEWAWGENQGCEHDHWFGRLQPCFIRATLRMVGYFGPTNDMNESDNTHAGRRQHVEASIVERTRPSPVSYNVPTSVRNACRRPYSVEMITQDRHTHLVRSSQCCRSEMDVSSEGMSTGPAKMRRVRGKCCGSECGYKTRRVWTLVVSIGNSMLSTQEFLLTSTRGSCCFAPRLGVHIWGG